MKTHPYLRAYVAGIAIPTAVFPLALAVFCVARFHCHVDIPVERAMIFPLALVPTVWGLWNILFVALHGHRWLSLGAHGALLPLLLAPAGLAIAHLVELPLPGFVPTVVAVFLPVGLAIYYLVWKFAVHFLNEMLGIA